MPKPFVRDMCDYKGFTILEVIAVLVIIAVVSTLAIKQMGGIWISAYSDADRLVSDLRYAQSLSMTRAQDVTVTITSSGWNLSGGLRFADGETARQTGQGVTFPSGSRISLTFEEPKGKVDSDKTITLERGSNSITVKVYGGTGYVEIFQ
ncbi:MAG: GspH/FimT family pseudopilin [Desulfotignum sp.]|nr:GspH/FimT family pseudopilin [Desulfotignum sp.]MCF8126033.1 GspH/FimT family pseudopilin [Desulfotignum sp.]